MTPQTILLIIVVAGIGTFSLRASFITFLGQKEMPAWFVRGLKYVPVAVLTALITPAFLQKNGTLFISAHNERMLAAIAATVAAAISKNVLWTLGAGMGTLWLLQWLLA